MQELKCKLCGAGLILDASGSWAKCEYCGMKYSLETMQQMVKALNNIELKVSGVATLDTLLSRAETFIKLGETGKATEILIQITEEYPQSYEGWWRLAQILYIKRSKQSDDELSRSREFKYALELAPDGMKEVIRDKQAKWAAHIKKVQSISEQYFQAICAGDYSILENKIWSYQENGIEKRLSFFSFEKKLYVLNNFIFELNLKSTSGYVFADKLTIAGVKDHILVMHSADDNSLMAYAILLLSNDSILINECCGGGTLPALFERRLREPTRYESSCMHDMVAVDYCTVGSTVLNVIERAKNTAKQSAWKSGNRCCHCGGVFGLFNYCKSCGEKRDY